MMGRCATAALALFFGLAPPAAVAGEVSPATLDPQRVTWRELGYEAHKLGISVTVEVQLREGQADLGVPGAALRAGPGPSAREQGEILLESASHLPGRTFLAHEHISPVLAGAREIIDTETGAKNHRKTYTLTPRGFLFELVEPAGDSEVHLPPEGWTRQERTFKSYPRSLSSPAAVTGPVGLLYAASASSMSVPGDSMTINVLVQTQVERVTVEVGGVETAEVDFQESSGTVVRGVRGQIQALRLVARSQPVDPSAASAFRLFGLEGDVEMLWDPARRVPVEISGHVKLLGRVQVRLVSVTLR